jgi:hypothetical protein
MTVKGPTDAGPDNPAVNMDAMVRRIDPTASNSRVQANAADGSQMGVVRIDDLEFEGAIALSPDVPGTEPNRSSRVASR